MSSIVVSRNKSETHHRSNFLLAGLGIWTRLLTICGILLMVLTAVSVYAAATGSTPIPYSDVANTFLQYIGIDRGIDKASSTYRIITIVRIPRLMVAALTGAALACAGTTMQGLFRNPLADPGIIGVSAGASLGVVVVITQTVTLGDLWLFNDSSKTLWQIPSGAFMGAMGASLLVYLLSLQRGRTNLVALLLAGVALSSVLGALSSILLLQTADTNAVRAILFWLVGSLEGRGWDYFYVMFIPITIGAALILLFSRDLNLLLLGEETAQSLGISVQKVRLILLALSSLLTAVAVSAVGAVSFVGLVVPHMLRLVIGPDHRVLLPASLIGGAAFLIFADTLARSLIAPEQLQVGMITALIGGPFFLFLLWRSRRQFAAF